MKFSLMKKLFVNFNKYFINYIYLKYFEYFNDYINKNLTPFERCYSFHDFKDI